MVSDEKRASQLAQGLWGACAGVFACVLSYWSAVARLREAWGVETFPPGSAAYWWCWALPLVVLAAVGAVVFGLWRRARAAVAGFVVACALTGIVMCGFGYSVDSMPYYM